MPAGRRKGGWQVATSTAHGADLAITEINEPTLDLFADQYSTVFCRL